MKKLFSTLCLLTLVTQAFAQFDDNQYNQIDPNGNISKRGQISPDSLGSNKEIPKGIKVWTIDSRFGDRTDAVPDTVSHMFMNSIFTTGLRGEYNSLGNAGSPRINRIFIDRRNADDDYPEEPYFKMRSPFIEFENAGFNRMGVFYDHGTVYDTGGTGLSATQFYIDHAPPTITENGFRTVQDDTRRN